MRLCILCLEKNCADSIDDHDGDMDCADADCAGSTQCGETDCFDGVDNDGDGNTDCTDSVLYRQCLSVILLMVPTQWMLHSVQGMPRLMTVSVL